MPTYTLGNVALGTNTDDAWTQPIELPFSLTTATGHSKIQINTNGVVNDNQSQTTIDVFNVDMDGLDGGILAGTCSLNLRGVTKQAYFITWNNFKFYNQSNSIITMQLILVKNGDWGYTAIRNYQQISTSDISEITYEIGRAHV